jgi:ATP-dependent Clp protease ATP-binding subunit ClpX
MTEPRNAIVKQYQKLVGMDNCELEVTESAVYEIAKKAIELKTGARGLRTIFENLMLDCMYDIPSDDNVEKVIIDGEVVKGEKKPELVYKKSA